MPNSNSITLYVREGKSDKVWRATFNQGVDFQNTAEYTVTFEWGRRGAAMPSVKPAPSSWPIAARNTPSGAPWR